MPRIHRSQQGFTLFELLITLAVIGVVSALAVPAYRTYIDTANMSKVSANFEEAIRSATQNFSKDQTRVMLGLPAQHPTTTWAWATHFNEGYREKARYKAPGGGPAYLPGDGDPVTGAIGVVWDQNATPHTLIIRRPAFSSLIAQEARINQNGVEIIKNPDP